MNTCDYCQHVEMCGWRKSFEERGCDFFDDGNIWIPVSERLPETIKPVKITWVNRNPTPYYEHIKDVPQTATGHYHNGRWYWFSVTSEDYLAEYGDSEIDRVHEDVEIIAWMPLPEPYNVKSEE